MLFARGVKPDALDFPVLLLGCKPLASMLDRFDFGVAWYRIIADASRFVLLIWDLNISNVRQ